MSLHLVRYTIHVRRELRRAVEGMTESDLEKRVGGMNSVAWMIAHLAAQEQSYWLESRALPVVADLSFLRKKDESATPNFAAMWAVWEDVIKQSDSYLLSLTETDLKHHFTTRKSFEIENIGSLLTRVIGHYYLHIGQITVIRKLLDYDVPAFVGSQEGAYYE